MNASFTMERILIVVGLGIWLKWVSVMEFWGFLPSRADAARLSLAAMGGFCAWGLWKKGAERADREAHMQERAAELGDALDLRDLQTGDLARQGIKLSMGTRVNLGPCPHCGSGPATVMPSPPGSVEIRCRGCGLESRPPILQPTTPDSTAADAQAQGCNTIKRGA